MKKIKKLSKNTLFYITGSLLVVVIVFTILNDYNSSNPEKVVAKLSGAIVKAQEKGDYHCCIEPACTMCYLGNWKFEKGTCLCDDAIIDGNYEDVCPECNSGIEKGFCSSAKEEYCKLNTKDLGGRIE